MYDRVKITAEGSVARYIPELAKVDPALFGVALATTDGHIYTAGDAGHPFTIQSVSKPLVFGLALEDHGADAVLKRVGVEPSGDAFNSIVMDERNNRPLNPMVNAGAIACAALVGGSSLKARQTRVIEAFSRYAGRPLSVDWDVFESERSTGHRNRAIAYLELSSSMIDGPIEDHLDLYFTQCSILVTATDLAVMAATLANAGVNPITGERALAITNVKQLLTVMATCGMYDWSGEWMYRVGLPAKSGVGGGILAVLPGQLGLGTFSPLLDEVGNSARGVRVCEEFASEFHLHLLATLPAPHGVVRRHYNAATVPSKRVRSAEERSYLDKEGDAIGVFELQGDLYFATAEQLLRRVEARDARMRFVILDTHRVERANSSAVSLVSQLSRSVEKSNGRLVFVGCSDYLRRHLVEAQPTLGDDRFWSKTDDALEACEACLLAEAAGFASDTRILDAAELEILRELAPDELNVVNSIIEVVGYAAGAYIVRSNDVADRVFFLASGSATAQLGVDRLGESVSRRLVGFGAGVAFGETAFFGRALRTADVIADCPLTCLELSVHALELLAASHPSIEAKLLRAAGASLSQRLRRANDQIRALEA